MFSCHFNEANDAKLFARTMQSTSPRPVNNLNHIIQKFVFTIGAPKNQFIFDLINSKIVEIATHKHGCCVLQKCIEGANKAQRVNFL